MLDPNDLLKQAQNSGNWLALIPALVTMLAHWYTNNKTGKTVNNTVEKTSDMVVEKAAAAIQNLNERVASVEGSVSRIAISQVTMAEKMMTAIDKMENDIGSSKEMIQKVLDLKNPPIEKVATALENLKSDKGVKNLVKTFGNN